MTKPVAEGEPSAMLNFKKLSDQVYVQAAPQLEHEPSAADPPDPSHPSTVIIYGWGDARPRHVAKYVAGYRALFPRAQIVLIYSPILRALYQNLEARTQSMVPVLQAVYPSVLADSGTDRKQEQEQELDGRVLLHVMSNAGGINCAATMNAFAEHTGGAGVMPHGLMVCDSTPGSTDFVRNVGAWSRAMTVGAAGWFPWPAKVTQGLAAVFLACLYGAGWVLGATSAGEYSRRAVNDARLSDGRAKRLYLYSKEDEIIRWDDIEQHAADARQKGWSVTAELFEGTPHVGHMRAHGEQYWAAIAAAWKEAVAGVDGRNEETGTRSSKI